MRVITILPREYWEVGREQTNYNEPEMSVLNHGF